MSGQQPGDEPPGQTALAGGEVTGTLLEVAVALPMYSTYTYRDPRPGPAVPVGSQVVVPFGPRTMTGFVVAHLPASPVASSSAADEGKRPRLYDVKDIEGVMDDGGLPAFDPPMVSFARWIADYYVAPLGEVLRGALPQGERVVAVRSVRLTPAGEDFLRSQPALPGVAAAEGPAGFLRLLSRGPVALRLLRRRDPQGVARLPRWVAAGLVEVGDALSSRKAEKTWRVAFAVAGASAAALPPRAKARHAVWEKLAAAATTGVPWAALSAQERLHVRALVDLGLARLEEQRPPVGPVRTDAPAHGVVSAAPLPATPAQRAAIDALCAALGQGYAPHLLYGVTGSGKTEVYLQAIAEARARGLGALVLVPEIALTPQLAGRFRARFGDDVAVLHSALAPRERLAAWRRLRRGEVGIAVGARSAVFAPVERLGIIVVDEEHDPSFKQEEGVRYHGRDLALVRAQRAGAVAVLGSATPSLESFRNVTRGRLRLLRLPERATPRPLPTVSVVDLRRWPPGADGVLSRPLVDAVNANLTAKQQTILFLNRRGFSPLLLCRGCGHIVRCSDCAVSLTYHQGQQRLVCHYCGRLETVPPRCPSCKAPRLERLGAGTERVEDVVRARFPGARVARLDRDTAGAGVARGPRGQAGAEDEAAGGPAAPSGAARGLEGILAAMHAGAIDILVGTQMVTKGHDFPSVTLVGVLQPDQGLAMPDFRAAERTFQLLEQVAGRAGRGEHPGTVLVQTFEPEHPAIQAAVTHDYESFATAELAAREDIGYPPAVRMLALRFDGPEAKDVAAHAARVAEACRAVMGESARLRGPAEAPIERLRGRSRFQIWLSAPERGPLAAAARAALALRPTGDVRMAVDFDPQSVL